MIPTDQFPPMPDARTFLELVDKLSKYGKLCAVSLSCGSFSVSYHAEPDQSMPNAIREGVATIVRAQGNHLKPV